MSEHYRREFDVWLEAFKQGDLFEEIVEGFDHDWSLIYKELHRIFKRNVQIIFHCFETQNSLTHLNNLLQNTCTYL